MAASGTTRVADVRLSAFERLPWRRIILVVLAVLITTVAVLGVYKTFSLDEPFSAEGWKNLIVQGIAQGAILAMIALGYSLVYGILRMINFAHGEVFMAGAFISYFFADAYARSGFLDRNTILALAIILGVAIASSMGTAVLLERLAYRPLRNAPRLVPLITAIGASLFIQNAFRGFFGAQPYAFPRPDSLDGNLLLFGVEVRKVYVLVFVIAIIAMIALQAFVARSKTGRSMRAVAEDREIASLMGINVDRTIRTTFALGGALAGIAAVLYSLAFTQVVFTMGFRPGIAAFTAAVLGGIGSITGAALGGFMLGILQAVGPQLFLSGFGIPSPNSLRDAFVFLVLIIVLIFRPGGLLGTEEPEKV